MMSKKNKSLREAELSRALKLYDKQSRRLAYNKLPNNVVLETEKWNLSSWTLIMSDNCLCQLLERRSTEWVLEIDLSGGDKITDVGLNMITDKLPNLKSVSLENAFNITENGLKSFVKGCQKLQKLNLSGCLGISGIGFAILGQHACDLVHLEVSGCRQITSWAFTKVFEGLKKLEFLDVSYCSSMNDQGLRVLADCCGSLSRLNLRECRQISDVGILSLSKGPCNLLSIILSRNDLVSRITDVSLLALAEGCSKLESLDLSGCEMITDVGVSWLAKGCKEVECLNFTNCMKITNGGLRYLSEECGKLRTILLKNVKRVSDVGIRFLAIGCPDLEYVNASGLCLLTDGSRRDFGYEGLQALSKSVSSKTMKKLNLHGCFRVCEHSIDALSSMKHLSSLVLSGCKSLSVEALAILLQSSTRISNLSFATCGECVSDKILESIGNNLHGLKTLDLTDCVNVGRKGLKSLSQCSSLISLNLSGCKSVSNESILAFGEGNFKPGIRELFLNRCVKLNDTALTWIADSFKDRALSSGNVTLITLALKGTKVTPRALMAIQSYFQYSVLKSNAVFFGFLSLSRANDRRKINDHARTAHSVVMIQATMRARRCRLIVSKAREQHTKSQRVTQIAAYWRGWLARSLAKTYRRDRWRRRVAAVKLQCFIRSGLARICTKRLRFRRWRSVAPVMAITIQKEFRGYRGRKLGQMTKRNREKKQVQREASVIKLQSLSRMFIAIKQTRLMRDEAAAVQKARIESCIRIQRIWRSELARQKLNELKLELFKIRRKQKKAGRCIVRCIRRYRLLLCIQDKIIYKRWLHENAHKIQNWYGQKVEDAKLRAELHNLMLIKANDSAVKIQSYVRRYLAELILITLKNDKKELDRYREEKATVLTYWCRLQLARTTANQLRKNRDKALKQQFIIQSEAAVQIEAFWRGCTGRKITRLAAEKLKSRWKEMWSEEDGAHFYYNQMTGESRWIKPQELLDLDPRPICSNCSFYDAQIECSNCSEYFCRTCFDAVHSGGKRRSHKFRCLYDYYEKRIEYDENEYPSLWPKEIKRDNYGWYKVA